MLRPPASPVYLCTPLPARGRPRRRDIRIPRAGHARSGAGGRPQRAARARYRHAPRPTAAALANPPTPTCGSGLIEALWLHAGQYRVQRLYAALSQRHEELREIFRQLGFASYTQQIVLRLEGPDWDQGVTVAPMRAQARRHDWAIHRLYGLTAPHLVQQAEARVARDWQLPITEGWRRAPRRGWVLGTDDSPIAALRLMSGPAAHVFTLLINPDSRDVVTDVLRFGLGQIVDTLPVYLLLREYQSELLAPASDLGFQPIGEQALLFKQTTVAVRRSSLLRRSSRGQSHVADLRSPRSARMRGNMTDPRAITSNIDLLLDTLPLHIRQSIEDASDDKENLLEIIIDLGRLPEARYRGRERFLSDREIVQVDIDYVAIRN